MFAVASDCPAADACNAHQRVSPRHEGNARLLSVAPLALHQIAFHYSDRSLVSVGSVLHQTAAGYGPSQFEVQS